MSPAETILVVEDNPDVAELLTRDFLPNLGYNALHAGSGEAALNVILKSPPELLILDFNLPGMDGITMLRRLSERAPAIPTILVTAHGSEQVAVDAFRLGICDYLTKPLDLDQLVQSIDSAFRSARLKKERDSLICRLERQVRETTVLSRVGQLVTSSLETDEVLRRIVEAGVYLTGAEEGFLLLYDAQSEEMTLRAEKNLGDREVAIRRVPISDNLLGQIISSGKPLRTTQRVDRERLKLKTGYLVRSSLHVPVKARDQVLGVLSVANALKLREFADADELLLVALSDYAAIAIHNARLYDESRRRAQQALNYAHELDDARRSEQVQRQALDNLRSNFLNALGHELKTPLIVVLQSLELLRDSRLGSLNEEQGKLIDTLSEQSRYLQHMIGGLLTFATFSAKQGELKLVKTPIASILDEAEEMAKFKAAARNVTFKDRRADRLPQLEVDPERLIEAINHLLDNAVKFCRPQGTVTLDTEVIDGRLYISVIDEGPGIPAADLQRIWDSFLQMSSSLERGLEGLGLGLAMARCIVEAHNGQISVESKVGEGSTFTITLPLPKS